jgi:hypothetical protein
MSSLLALTLLILWYSPVFTTTTYTITSPQSFAISRLPKGTAHRPKDRKTQGRVLHKCKRPSFPVSQFPSCSKDQEQTIDLLRSYDTKILRYYRTICRSMSYTRCFPVTTVTTVTLYTLSCVVCVFYYLSYNPRFCLQIYLPLDQ